MRPTIVVFMLYSFANFAIIPYFFTYFERISFANSIVLLLVALPPLLEILKAVS